MGRQHSFKSSISLGNQAKNLLSRLQVGSTICQNTARSLSSLTWITPKAGVKIQAGKLSLGAGKEKEGVGKIFCISTSQ